MNKKYFSKALCYADRAQYFSILIITSLFLVFSSLVCMMDGPKSMYHLLDISLISIPIILINSLIIFFSYTSKKSKQFYMTTQPYSRDAMIITKFISFSLLPPNDLRTATALFDSSFTKTLDSAIP